MGLKNKKVSGNLQMSLITFYTYKMIFLKKRKMRSCLRIDKFKVIKNSFPRAKQSIILLIRLNELEITACIRNSNLKCVLLIEKHVVV